MKCNVIEYLYSTPSR